ncbi:MAG: UDP-N-acetylmuramoyl-L-alanine--D-glutamate ligase [Chlamydiae bacterium]|nr:UDP-N-acetylmuramoyl-L-alanine--D-glutamate ligase [Chlamydiota bacterium]
MKQVLVLGLGISGKAAAKWLLMQKYLVIGADQRFEALKNDPEITLLLEKDLKLVSDQADIDFSSLSFVILSPGISTKHPLVIRAIAAKVEVIGEIEFALRQIKNRCIGITGTNGKTTTTLLIAHILQSAGIAARALGNVGCSLSSYLAEVNVEEILVLELSSFQLETIQSRTLSAAVILNIKPDHLDRYASFEEYRAAKMRIGQLLREEGKLFVPREIKAYFPDAEVLDEDESHSQNEQAARKLLKIFGVSESDFCAGLETFRRPAHRLEWVAEKMGCVYYNDSKATNVDSVMHAVRSLKGPLILLVGGRDKGAPYTPWIECFQGKVKMMVAFGEASLKIEAELAPFFPFVRVATMEDALRCIESLGIKGASVLLSPGCSSYDQFRSFEHRGDEFKRLVREER